MTMTACLDCGAPADGPRCPEHTHHRPKPPPAERGYDAAWTKLSKRARKLQPWCTDCGSCDDLQADHLPSAWERKAAGKPVRIQDVEVCCGPCNRARGAARGNTTRGDTPAPPHDDPPFQADFRLHTGVR